MEGIDIYWLALAAQLIISCLYFVPMHAILHGVIFKKWSMAIASCITGFILRILLPLGLATFFESSLTYSVLSFVFFPIIVTDFVSFGWVDSTIPLLVFRLTISFGMMILLEWLLSMFWGSVLVDTIQMERLSNIPKRLVYMYPKVTFKKIAVINFISLAISSLLISFAYLAKF